MNVLNGGRHADNTVDFQEFMIAPHHAPACGSDPNGHGDLPRFETGAARQGLQHAVGDEGGFAPDLKSNDEAVELIWKRS